MVLPLAQLKEAASLLSLPERAELASFLLDTLDESQTRENCAEWLAVAERRMAYVKAGKIAGIPAEHVCAVRLSPKP
jgi:putative addiction module component (TIGR02574 family)